MMAWFDKLPLVEKVGWSVLILVLLGVVFLLLSFGVRRLKGWQTLKKIEDDKERIGLKIEIIKTTASIVGGAFFLVTIYVAWQNLIVTQEKHTTDLFTKAIEQLGGNTLEVRLGGIYALERIARDSDKDHGPIMEVLTAYVRANAPWPLRRLPPEVGPKPATSHPGASAASPAALRADIQAILNVIGRRRTGYQERPLDLRHTDLRRADLAHASLEKAILILTNLHLADLRYANLKDGNLVEVNLEEANLGGAILQGANLDGANLIGRVNLFRVNLERASLVSTKLEGAHLEEANLQRADLKRADLRGAWLFRANLRGADLKEANLQGANLETVKLQGTHLKKANLQGANLERANLEGANLLEANLQKANLSIATLYLTVLIKANLQGADLGAADLEGAHLVGANLQGANLRYARLVRTDLKKADLRGVTDLTQKQLDSAIIDEKTRLPDSLKHLEKSADSKQKKE